MWLWVCIYNNTMNQSLPTMVLLIYQQIRVPWDIIPDQRSKTWRKTSGSFKTQKKIYIIVHTQ